MSATLDPMRRVLILGGTSEAFQLATILTARPYLTVITSLAGRLTKPHLPGGMVRIGGFGGVDGLMSYLQEKSIDVVIDVTHPFAAQISRNAEQACRKMNVPLLSFERPPWSAIEQDQWTHVADMHAAALLVGKSNSRIFLSIGRQEVGAFAHCTNSWFLIRAIDRPAEPLPPHCRVILDRGPFDLDAESKLLREESINLLITKNSGGPSTYSNEIDLSHSASMLRMTDVGSRILRRVCTSSPRSEMVE